MRRTRTRSPLLVLLLFVFQVFLVAVCEDDLRLNASVSGDPAALLSLRSSSPEAYLCSFPGVVCDSRRRVVSISISAARRHGGALTPAISDFKELRSLSLPFNNFSGSIPYRIWRLRKLETLDLKGNSFDGRLPLFFPPRLRVLKLAGNRIEGVIPLSISRCLDLEILDLSGNRIVGSVPALILGLPNLKSLNLSSNRLVGDLPDGFPSNCRNLEIFDLSKNQISGPILRLKSPSLEKKNLSDWVPETTLFHLNLSSNSQSSQLRPDRLHVYRRDVHQPSPPLSSPSSGGESKNGGLSAIEIASVASAAALVLVLTVIILLYIFAKIYVKKKKNNPAAVQSSGRSEFIIFSDIGVPLTYDIVVQATGNFNGSNCIGSGGFGATYKAEVSPGVLVAIKRLAVGRLQGVAQFQAEIKTLGRWRHPNLVTLIGYFSGDDEMFLIYNYLPGGNLEKFIDNRRQGSVEWPKIYKVAVQVARALCYLHDNCAPRVIHRDVKPSNILLDDDLNAYLSDFGLARLLGNSQTHATTGVAGTFGYVAPEYAMTCRVSDKADVYSYGVVLMEMLSDKKVLDPSFADYGDGFDIVAWANLLIREGRGREFFREEIWALGPRDELVEVLKLAVESTVETLSSRPKMRQVLQRLKQLRHSNR